MKPGMAMAQTFSGSPDFFGGHVVTMSPGGPAVDDAGTVYIVRDEEIDEDWPDGNRDAPILVKKTTLAEMMSYCLDGWRTFDGYTEAGHVPASDALAAALRAAADMLDAGKRPNELGNRLAGFSASPG